MTPKLKACPEKDECMSLKGEAIGMYHCGWCNEMILAGEDPTAYCPLIKGQPTR